MKPSFIFNSNTLRVNGREWLGVLLAVLLTAAAVPRLWPLLEPVAYDRDYRIPYEASYNYWFIERWLGHAANEFPLVIVGDSVIWGQYTGRQGTLSRHLNDALDARLAANLGLDGLHPAAMPGLFRYYGRALRGRAVLLHLNLLWMSSPRHDLTVEEPFRFNHPRLVPQIRPRIPCYQPSMDDIAGILAERHLPVMRWIGHMQQTYFDHMNLPQWTLMHPRENPLRAVDFEAPAPEDRPRSPPVSWREAGLEDTQDLPWLDLDASFQWRMFLETLALLRARGNRVFVLIGPFNTHMLSDESARHYAQVLHAVTERFDRDGLPYHAFEGLPADLFADASHPLDEGYRKMARALVACARFQAWAYVNQGE